ncbi:MAG: Chromate resistance protein ChrB [Thermomicrobiales bacterium]
MNAVWHLFIYRLPPNPSRTRVAVWRELRRFGALPLQQSVVVVPELADLVQRLDAVETRIASEGGISYRFRLSDLSNDQLERLTGEWNRVRDQEYAEIVEECRTKFKDEIEFELFRKNLTGAEAEEIEADLEKIRSWFDRIRSRDHFAAAGRAEAEIAIEESQVLLDDFVERVFEAESISGGISLDLPGSRIDTRALIESALTDDAETKE